jgi:hypothetical protein
MENFSATFSDVLGADRLRNIYAATTFACDRVPRNVKSAFVQPTIALCKQPYLDARMRFRETQDRYRSIITRRGADDKTAHRITNHLKDRDEAGYLLYVTHAGFLRTPHWRIALTPGTCSSMSNGSRLLSAIPAQ